MMISIIISSGNNIINIEHNNSSFFPHVSIEYKCNWLFYVIKLLLEHSLRLKFSHTHICSH